MLNEQAWLTLGAIAEMTGDLDHTIRSYEKVLAHNNTNTQALMSVGTCYEKAEEFSKAGEYFHVLVGLNNANGDAWGHLGYCFLMQNDLQNSYTAYQHALYHIRNPKVGFIDKQHGSPD